MDEFMLAQDSLGIITGVIQKGETPASINSTLLTNDPQGWSVEIHLGQSDISIEARGYSIAEALAKIANLLKGGLLPSPPKVYMPICGDPIEGVAKKF